MRVVDSSAKPTISCEHLSACYDPNVNVIVRDREILGGTPVFSGTRVPVQTLFDYLEGAQALEDFLQGFPTVSREAALAALEEAKHLLLARS
jgi:uncharacterized protein (DUF433 family)